ncbi:MAG: hypothetical protein ACW99G_22895, partial [Candidatus Thorarchaeota archaeon]
MAKIQETTHPDYDANVDKWAKYKLTMEGGNAFVQEYLRKFSNRESGPDFSDRQTWSPCAAHAKSAVLNVKNSIFSRLADVARQGGPQSYQDAIIDSSRGVDLSGNTMTSFIGRLVITELLSKAKVGVYVDNYAEESTTKADVGEKRPYIYVYKAEDIKSWAYDDYNNLSVLLLEEKIYEVDEETNLPTGTKTQYRLLTKTDTGVDVEIYDEESEDPIETFNLDIKEIPFVI